METKYRNPKGPIAETYATLQGIPILERASKHYFTDKCSDWGIIKAMHQIKEIGIQNLVDLFERLSQDIKRNRIGKATIKLGWIRDINNLLLNIHNLCALLTNKGLENKSSIKESLNSYLTLERVYKKADLALKNYIKQQNLSISSLLKRKNLDNRHYRFLHEYKIIAHEILIWSKKINNLIVPSNTTYEDFIGLIDITTAVNEPHIEGDTFFKQFRCLHQIPEILTVEVNNRIELSIVQLRKKKYTAVHLNLNIANKLFEVAVNALKPIISNLSHTDYHELRENLGLTSGSHSVNLHYHLFRDLYPLIASEYVEKYLTDELQYKRRLQKNYPLKLIETELLNLNLLLTQWRNLHLHLPRINLGENKTKSLIGAKEAIASAKKMQRMAESKDPLNPLLNMYNLTPPPQSTLILSDYISSNKSFDYKLGAEIGKITKNRFKDVQERRGFFALQYKFIPPAKRKV